MWHLSQPHSRAPRCESSPAPVPVHSVLLPKQGQIPQLSPESSYQGQREHQRTVSIASGLGVRQQMGEGSREQSWSGLDIRKKILFGKNGDAQLPMEAVGSPSTEGFQN